jgi:WD40 repeat protein
MIFSKSIEFNKHGSAVYSLAFDGNYLFSGSADCRIARWNISKGIQDDFTVKTDFPVYAISLVRQKSLLWIGLSNGNMHVIDLINRKEIKFYQQHKSAIFTITENKLKEHIYSTDADGNLAVWDMNSLNLLMFVPIGCGKIRRIHVSDDGEAIVLACQDGYIRCFETLFYNEILLWNAHNGGVSAVLFDRYGEKIISGGKDGYISVWDAKSGVNLLRFPAHNFAVYDLIYMKNKDLLISCSRDKSIKIWNANNFTFEEKITKKEAGHFHSVNAMVALNSNAFASSSDDKNIIVWNISDILTN